MIYTKDEIVNHWDMKTFKDDFSSLKVFDNAIITMDSCFDSNGNLIPFSPIRRSSINWKKVQVYPTPTSVSVNKKISDAYYINFFHGTHWGHFLTESLARMHDVLCSDIPTKNIIVRFEHIRSFEWLKNVPVLKEYNIIPFTENLLVEKLYLPVPTMVNFHYVVPEHIQTLNKYSSYYTSNLEDVPEKIYLSRSKLPKTHRVNFGEEILEKKLIEYGWSSIHFQEYSIGDQVKILSNAKYISGCMGSAFHNLMMCKSTPEKILYLVPEIQYIFPNYAAHDILMDNNSFYINCQKLTDYNKRNFSIEDPYETARMIEEILCQN